MTNPIASIAPNQIPSFEPGAPGFLTVARAVGWVTFREIIRDKILYNIFLFAILLFGIGVLASRLTFVRADRIILDFGLSAIGIACTAIGVFIGAGMLGREFERRTIFVALSRPVSKQEFILGKFCGIALVLFLNWVLLSMVYLGILVVASSGFGHLHSTMRWALLLALAQSFVMASIAVMFSSFSTTTLSVMISLGLYLVGSNVSQVRMLASRTSSPIAMFALNLVASLLPNLENFNLGFKVTYGLPVTWEFGMTAMLYSLVIIGMNLTLAGFMIRGRET